MYIAVHVAEPKPYENTEKAKEALIAMEAADGDDKAATHELLKRRVREGDKDPTLVYAPL